VIKHKLSELSVKHIKYHKLEGQEFDSSEYKESFDEWVKNDNFVESKLVKTTKSVYEYIKCDSIVEVKFAQELEKMDEIEFFLKLPSWFKINTPRGSYNPDWAITVNVDGKQETFFVIETKGTSNLDELTPSQADKIRCGFKHFELISDVDYDYFKSFDEFAHVYIHEN